MQNSRFEIKMNVLMLAVPRLGPATPCFVLTRISLSVASQRQDSLSADRLAADVTNIDLLGPP